MKQQKMTVLFYLNKAKINKKGVCPLYCRLTYQKKRKQFSTGLFVKPENWQSKKQIVNENDENQETINAQIQLVNSKLETTYLKLLVGSENFDVDTILDLYFGKTTNKQLGVLKNFKEYLDKLEELIGKDIKASTHKKFEYVYNDVQAFIKHKFSKSDIMLGDLKPSFLDDFEHYLKTVNCQKQVTANKVIQRFKKSITIALSKGYIDKDPFILYRAKRVKKEVAFLSTKELKKLESHEFAQPRLNLVKDLFVFSCYTGLAYYELSKLGKKHIVDGFDGNKWIQMKREKTDRMFSVPLLNKPLILISKYQTDSEWIFPRITNQRYNSYLKEIAAILGIEIKLTTHIARKTFASTVLLYNDVPMEIVSELLGHSDIRITQESYAKVVQKKVSNEMKRLNNKLKF